MEPVDQMQIFLKENVDWDKYEALVMQRSENIRPDEPNLPLILTLELRLFQLATYSGDLYQKVVFHPSKYRKICQEYVTKFLIMRLISKGLLPLRRIQFLVHCTALPIELTNAASPAAFKGPLVMLRGYVLIGRSTPVTYKHCTLYICGDSKCPEHITYLAEADESPSTEVICPICQKQEKEYVPGRGEGERVIGNFMKPEAFKPILGKRYDAVKCSITDSLIKDLELGVEYDLWGRYEMRRNEMLWFDVWGITRPVKWPVSISPIPLPPNIQKYKNTAEAMSPNSPWVFVSSLASKLGCGFCPSSSFINLKMGLLLSLATLSGGLPVPIMCIGPDTSIAAQLMDPAADLAPRHLSISFPAGDTASRKPTDGYIWMESGSLTMSRTGVCTIGEWEILKPAHSDAVLKIVSAGLITMDNKMGAAGPIIPFVQQVPLRSAIWTYWGYYKWNSQKNLLEKLVDTFGVPFLADSNNDDSYLDYMLQGAMDGSLYEKEMKKSVPVEEFTEFLSMANSLSVELDEEATQLIKRYYVASRRVRADSMPAHSIGTMIALAESHARLNLRKVGTRADVIAVIILYEESLCHLHGNTISTPPSFKSCPPQDTNKKMLLFDKWLKSYLDRIVG